MAQRARDIGAPAGTPAAGDGSDHRRPFIDPPLAVDLSDVPAGELAGMRAAADEIRECHRVLERGGINIVGELLRGHDTYFEEDHYPTGDVLDRETGAQYYYHAHRGNALEHGHFHTFVRSRGFPDTLTGHAPDGWDTRREAKDPVVHLVAISMDEWGFPKALFATNAWVTSESWYSADDVEQLIDRFVVDHAYPSWPTNRWVTAMLRLFRPQVRALLRHRDQVLESWSRQHGDADPLHDRTLEVTGWTLASVDAQRHALDALER